MKSTLPYRALTALLLGLGWLCPSPAEANNKARTHSRDGAESPARQLPAEESRFGSATFRNGLRKRGLTGLLELYLREFPPPDRSTSLLMLRDVKLEEFSDTARSPNERRAAIAEANRILQELIEDSPEDPRRFDWMFSLARSLLYDEAQAYFTSILYRGGTEEERRQLVALTARVVTVVTTLSKQLAEEYERIDTVSVREFEKLERGGYVVRLDELAPRTDYLQLWAQFYDALPRTETDPVRIRRLNAVLETLAKQPAVLNAAHNVSHVQVQSLLLAGMTFRRVNDHAAARNHLGRALSVADQIEDVSECLRIQWAVDLAWLERIRNERDAGRFHEALRMLARWSNLIAVSGGDSFGLRLVAAFEERSICQAKASAADLAGRPAESERYRQEAWQALARLARRFPDRRDEIYATLYDLIGAQAAPEQLDPFEQCALIAGLLFDASQSADADDPALARIIEVGERFLEASGSGAEALVPEVLYNMAVAQYRQGRTVQAARRFLEVARRHPSFAHALPAATFAVELAAAIHDDPSRRHQPEAEQFYFDALTVLVSHYEDSDAARYWRFFYAQSLEELQNYDAAAAQFTLVDRQHEHYLESGYLRLRSLAQALRQQCEAAEPDPLDVRRRVDSFFALHRELAARLTREASGDADAEGAARIKSLLARAHLLGAEVHVLPAVDRPLRALEALEGFEAEYSAESGLTARVWRVRLLAYERLGRLEEAAEAIPVYMAADSARAGETLQALYMDLVNELEQPRGRMDRFQVQGCADLALLLAQQIHSWAETAESASTPQERYALTIQLAEANLRAGQYARARELFESCSLSSEAPDRDKTPENLPVVLGHAEALYQLGETAAALPMFNRLATSLPPDDPIRWQSLLRDLQCRTALKHPPEGIIKVIEQQKTLGRNLGGPDLADKFEALLRENQRRIGVDDRVDAPNPPP